MMHRWFSSVIIAGLAAIAATGAAPDRVKKDAVSDGGFVTLFNGKDFTGWHGVATMDPRKFEAMAPRRRRRPSRRAPRT